MTISTGDLCVSREGPCQLIERKAFFFPPRNMATYDGLSFFNLSAALIICLFLVVLGLPCSAGFSVAVVSRGYCLTAVRSLLLAVASLVVKHRL